MGYSSSSLVVCRKLSPNHSGQRTRKIDRISLHCVVGQCTAEGLGEWFGRSSAQASSDYGIDKDGRVGMYVEEKKRSWCSSSRENDQRAVTIECASEKQEPYTMNEVVYDRLIDLCEDICRRNEKKKLLWLGDRKKSLEYQPKEDEMIITVHRWFANKSCPGDWLYSRLGDLAAKVTAKLGGNSGGNAGGTDCPFTVRVSIPNLNIRKGAGTNTAKTGKYTGAGVFTIVEVKSGKGADAGWGKLKSGAGWISLDYCQRV